MKLMVTGSKGLVGSEIQADIKVGREYDLVDKNQTIQLLKTYSPTHVIHCAAKVGGIMGNMSAMGEYFYNNMMIGLNMIEGCRLNGIEKLMVFSSTCVFPKEVEYPLTEDKIHLGPPHDSNYGYAYAKRALDIHIQSYNQQYNLNYFTAIPCNIYGPNDNYNLDNGHVIPSLIHKAYLAKMNREDITIWGSGKSLRQFIYSKDVASISEILIRNYNSYKPIILSTDQEYSIDEVITTICDIMKFNKKIVYDTSKPDGQHRKPADNTKLKSIIGDYKFKPLREGLEETIEYFIKNYESIRK